MDPIMFVMLGNWGASHCSSLDDTIDICVVEIISRGPFILKGFFFADFNKTLKYTGPRLWG